MIPDVGKVVDELVVIAYCASCPVTGVRVTAFTVIEVDKGVPLTVGVDTAAPSPIATALAVTVPDTATAAVASVTFACAMVEGTVIAVVFALANLGAPLMVIVTTVLLVRVAASATIPLGNPEMAKLAAVIVAAYVPFESVNTTLAPLTACPALRLVSPAEVTAMVGAGAAVVVIAALCTAVPSL